jgi:transcription elongation factor GreA
MSVDGQTYLTKAGLVKLKQELKDLKTVKRKEIASRIQDAKELGDLSENAEYAEAKNEQAFSEGRIIELENIVKNATVIDESNHSNGNGMVHIGSTVTIKSEDGEKQYTIVGSNEVNPVKGFISNESPLGQALIGRKVGDKLAFKAPKGLVEYKILKVS